MGAIRKDVGFFVGAGRRLLAGYARGPAALAFRHQLALSPSKTAGRLDRGLIVH